MAFLVVYISLCGLKYFNITICKKNLLFILLTVIGVYIVEYIQLQGLFLTILRVFFIYLIIRQYVSKDNDLEILAIILILETIAKCSYYIFILFLPLIIRINICDILLQQHIELQIISLVIVFIILIKYYHSIYFIKVKCNQITYALLCTCSLIALYGLEVIPDLSQQLREEQIYFLLLSFVYIVIINIIIYLYHNQLMKKEIESKVVLEQAKILKYEKDILSTQNRMIENIKHDLNYFKSMVNDDTKKHLNKTIKKIDDYHNNFIFNDYLLNNFISRIKTEMKENNKDLKLVITNTDISIDIKIYNQLIILMGFVIQNSINENIQLHIKTLDMTTVFEFMYLPIQDKTPLSKYLKNNDNIIFKQTDHQYMICSLVDEREVSL